MFTRRSVNVVLSLAILLSIAVICGKYRSFSTSDLSRKKQISYEALSTSSFLNLTDGRLETFSSDAGYFLFIFMSAGDCPSCLDEASAWNSLADCYPLDKYKVVLIITRSSLSEAKTLFSAYGFRMPVYLDSNDALTTMLPKNLPLKVLFAHNGTLLYTSQANQLKEDHDKFLAEVKAIVN